MRSCKLQEVPPGFIINSAVDLNRQHSAAEMVLSFSVPDAVSVLMLNERLQVEDVKQHTRLPICSKHATPASTLGESFSCVGD